MTLGNLRSIGPVDLDYASPSLRWTASESHGIRPCAISGTAELMRAQQLSELVGNPARRVTVGGLSGVVEYILFDGDAVGPFRGWYLLQSFDVDVDQKYVFAGLTPFSLDAAYLGAHRQVVVTRSARARPNDFGLAAQALLAAPAWAETDGEGFALGAGGAPLLRTYDPTSPHDGTRLAPLDGARDLALAVGDIGDLASVVLPDLADAMDYDGQETPRWITDRGGDCRAFDRREAREVYGPAHAARVPTDLVITNGLIRAWVGSRGLPPYLQVQALAGGEWSEVGYLLLSDPLDAATVLTAARLVRVTPDSTAIAITIQGAADAVVSLHRGERMLRVAHGAGRTQVLKTRKVAWSGLPPWTRLESATNGAGRFGLGIEAGRDDAMWDDDVAMWDDDIYTWEGEFANPDLRLRWPPCVTPSAWSLCFWYRPARAAADLDGAGLLSIDDVDGNHITTLILDAADERFRLTHGATTVASAVQTFAADSNVFLCARFSAAAGLSLSVAAGGIPAHTTDPAAVVPDETHHDIFLGASTTAWGDGNWGDGNWGGVSWADGVVDNMMIFADRLTDAEVNALAAATSRLDGLPDPEARLVWHLPGDAQALMSGAELAGGRRGDTAGPDAWGLTRGLVVLDRHIAATAGLAVGQTTRLLEVGAVLTTAGELDGLVDHQAQFAAANEQEVRVR